MKRGIAVLCFAVFLAGSAWAEGEQTGKPTFKFFFEGSVEYNDNIRLWSADKEGDYVITVAPGMTFTYPGEKNFFNFQQILEYRMAGSDITNFNPAAKILYRHSPSMRTSFAIWDRFQRSYIPESVGYDFDLNTLGLEAKHQFGPKLTGKIGYGNELMDYPTTSLADYMENRFSAGLEYCLTPRSNLMFDVSYGIRNFDEPADRKDMKDYDDLTGTVTLEMGVGARATVGMYAGYTMKEYDLDVPGALDGDDSCVTGGVYLSIPATARTSVKLYYDRSLSDTYYQYGKTIFDPVYSHIMDVIDASYRDAQVDKVGVNLNHRMSPKVDLKLDVAYSRNKADELKDVSTILVPVKRELDEELLEIGGGFSYRMTRNLSLGLSYTYGVRSSNVRDDYTYNAIKLGANVSF